MATEFGTGKSVFILAIVAGCFAVLWPNIFYPMLQSTYTANKNPVTTTQGGGCCDVIFDSDVNAIKLMTHLCETILSKRNDFNQKYLLAFQQGKLNKEIIDNCHEAVISKCGIDIKEFLTEKVRIGRSYKQMVDEIRSLNSSICLKHTFGVSMGEIGLPRRMRIWGSNMAKHLRQERPPHLRPEFMHPALREKGRAIPASHVAPKVNVQEGRPGPVPGLRPPMGGAGHVVPPPKGGGTMGIVMPMYTIGIVIFFLYTMMKLMFKKQDSSVVYEDLPPEPEFTHTVFSNNPPLSYKANKQHEEDPSKLVVSAISGIVREVNKQIRSELLEEQPIDKNGEDMKSIETMELEDLHREEEKVESGSLNDTDVEGDSSDGQSGRVKVLGMEMTESIEGGAKWSRPPTPLSRPSTPQNIYLPGSLPSQSQLLVSQSQTETLPTEDHAVVLTGKVTLSLIGLLDSIPREQVTAQEERSKDDEKSSVDESDADILPHEQEVNAANKAAQNVSMRAHDVHKSDDDAEEEADDQEGDEFEEVQEVHCKAEIKKQVSEE